MPIKEYYKRVLVRGDKVNISKHYPYIGIVLTRFKDLDGREFAVTQMKGTNHIAIVSVKRLHLIEDNK